ncbi:MAG: lytic transglycosylase domain-containing protein [bacterium]
MNSTTLIRWLNNGLFVGLMALMFISMINFSSNALTTVQEEERITELRTFVPEIHGVLHANQMRLKKVTEIYQIMNKYNRNLQQPQKYDIANEIYEMSLKYQNLDVLLICATITHESARTWRRDVKSPAGALGLMQIMPYTGQVLSKLEGIPWTTPEEVLYNPVYNIRLGCRYLSSLIEMYNLDGGLAAYNGGEKRAAKWLASGRDDEILYEETRLYIPAVLKLYDVFRNKTLSL